MGGRNNEAPGGRPVVMALRLTTKEAEQVDQVRRSLSRSQWLRWLIVKELKERS